MMLVIWQQDYGPLFLLLNTSFTIPTIAPAISNNYKKGHRDYLFG